MSSLGGCITVASKRSRRVIMIVSICFALGAIGMGWVYKDFTKHIDEIGHSQFRTVAIPLGSSKVIYARREGRGLNYDVLALSPDPNPCSHANPHTDYIFRYDGTPLYVAQTKTGLEVYRFGSVELPYSGATAIDVEIKRLPIEEFRSIVGTYNERHIRKVDVSFTTDSRGCR